MKIKEVSPNNLSGSFSKDLQLSKVWLIEELSKIKNNFNSIYILGSWYGNLGLFLSASKISPGLIVNVDIDKDAIGKSKNLAAKYGLKNIKHLQVDANNLNYKKATKSSAIINTSADDVPDRGWFENIPAGIIVAIQGRSNNPNSVNQFSNLEDLEKQFPMSQTFYKGQITLTDPETDYQRFMIIGRK
jgi:hypothetical protein